MNLNTNNDDWGWYIDTEKNTYINFTVEYYHNLSPGKKMNYHLNRLETIEEDNEKIIEENNKIENVEKGYFFKTSLTRIISTIFTYFTSLMFKLIR
jgi:hypothetical protein